MYFRYVDFKRFLDQIHVAKLINYEIDENDFFFVWLHEKCRDRGWILSSY